MGSPRRAKALLAMTQIEKSFMKEETYNEMELQKLEAEIRAMGIPYSEGEPDERYFANFRVHLLERIDAKEKNGIAASVWSWLTARPLRTLSLGAGLAGVIIAALLIRPTPENKIAKVQQQRPEQPAVIIPQVTEPEIAAAPEIHKSYATHKSHKANLASAKPKRDKLMEAAEKASNFAEIDARVSGSDDEPVNLESLSAGELESVLAGVESMK